MEAKQSMASTMAPVTKAARLIFADHLKAALVILVVLHHIAVIISLYRYRLRRRQGVV
jgi:hypothetical protein